MNELSNGISIYVEDTAKTFHTLTDWDFALSNNNYIGDPEMETHYIDVPYRDGFLDASTVLSGRPIYKKRSLAFNLGGKRDRMNWDSVISDLRNNINGRICKLTLDNDQAYYWRGRVYIVDFDRFRGLGSFTLSVPDAEPYKYSVAASNEPWLWDPFNFETDMITYQGAWVINGTQSHIIPAGTMPTTPQFLVTNLTSLTMTYNSDTFTFVAGTNVFPEVIINGDDDVTLTFSGQGTVQLIYRSGSL